MVRILEQSIVWTGAGASTYPAGAGSFVDHFGRQHVEFETEPLLDKYIKFAEIWGVRQIVELSGAKYGPEPAETLHRVNIMVNPNDRYMDKTFRIANVEAMALGLPIVRSSRLLLFSFPCAQASVWVEVESS